MVWIVVVYCVCAYIVTISLQLFLCYPIQRNWYYRTIIFEISFLIVLLGLSRSLKKHVKSPRYFFCSKSTGCCISSEALLASSPILFGL